MSAAIPVSVIVKTVVVRSGTDRRRTNVFCRPSAIASANAIGVGVGGRHRNARKDGEHQGEYEEHRFYGDGISDQLCTVLLQSPERGAAADGAEKKADQREERRGERKALGAGEGEPDEDHVAGHVRDEHPAEAEDADGVDDPGGGRHHDEKRWKGAVPFVIDETTPEGGCRLGVTRHDAIVLPRRSTVITPAADRLDEPAEQATGIDVLAGPVREVALAGLADEGELGGLHLAGEARGECHRAMGRVGVLGRSMLRVPREDESRGECAAAHSGHQERHREDVVAASDADYRRDGSPKTELGQPEQGRGRSGNLGKPLKGECHRVRARRTRSS